MKIVLLICISLIAFAAEIVMPSGVYKASGKVNDFVVSDGKLYCATSVGSVDIFDLKSKKRIKSIKIKKIKNFLGREINTKIYSVDVYKGRVLILSQATGGFREVRLFSDGKEQLLIGSAEKLYVAKANFIDQKNILIALLGNDIISYSIKEKKKNWSMQASLSKFSNFMMSSDRSEVVVADESGDLHLINTKDGSVVQVLSGENLDNVFAVDYKRSIVAAAGQDRRVGVYDLTYKSSYHIQTPFLVYAVGISPKAKTIAYASDENNNVTLQSLSTKSKLGVYGGNKMTLTKILFLNEKEFLVASDASSINYYKIK